MTPRLLHVEHVSGLVTVQDLGRPGWAHLGVTRSGAADRAALARANRLVGNPETAAGLELILGGIAVRAGAAHLVLAVSGAPCPLTLAGRRSAPDTVLDLAPGERLELGLAPVGLRAYLAVRGGLAVPAVLGSRSRDTLAGLGPEVVSGGAVLPLGPVPGGFPVVDQLPRAAPDLREGPIVLEGLDGPRARWLAPEARDKLWSATWQLTPEADRVGVRLSGPVLSRAAAYREEELPSEGLVPGAIQVPPSGQPVIFLVDHPTTGGYPVVAVLRAGQVDRVAQLRPGQSVRFHRSPGDRRGGLSR